MDFYELFGLLKKLPRNNMVVSSSFSIQQPNGKEAEVEKETKDPTIKVEEQKNNKRKATQSVLLPWNYMAI